MSNPTDTLLGSSYNNGRSTTRYLLHHGTEHEPRYRVHFTDERHTFTVHYFDRHTLDMDEATFLAGGDFCHT